MSDSLSTHEESSGNADVPKISRGPAREWDFVKKFENDLGARKFLKNENSWAIMKKRETHIGEKEFYRCNLAPKKGAQCECRVYIFKPHDSYESFIYESGKHTHSTARNVIKNADIRMEIAALASNA